MNFSDFIKLFEEIRSRVPDSLSTLIDYILLFVLILCAIWGLLSLLGQIKKIWIEQFWPLFDNKEQRKRRLNRERFADYLQNEIRQLNRREEWKDYRFAELEAEVEAEGRRRGFSLFPFFQSTKRGLRREKSLSKALELSKERLILVEGDPGSGKSLALRHVAVRHVSVGKH